VVSQKTLRQIWEKDSACKGELERIDKLQEDLSIALSICGNSRGHLKNAKERFTCKSLKILKNVRKKETINQLLSNLKIIRTLVSLSE